VRVTPCERRKPTGSRWTLPPWDRRPRSRRSLLLLFAMLITGVSNPRRFDPVPCEGYASVQGVEGGLLRASQTRADPPRTRDKSLVPLLAREHARSAWLKLPMLTMSPGAGRGISRCGVGDPVQL
jgi:hypothetical protein